MGEAVSTSVDALMQTRGSRLWIKLFRDADTQANSLTIPLYTPITAPQREAASQLDTIYGTSDHSRGGGRGLQLLDSLRPLMINQA